MSRKVYFYTVDLKDLNSDLTLNHRDIKDLLISIIDENAVDVKDMKVLDLTRNNELHYSADIFSYKENVLFMRMSSQKPSGSYIHRDYTTNIPEGILEGISEEEEGIEIYTYALLDYNTGIVSLVNQKGAPNYKILNYFCALYNPSFSLRFLPIPNPNGIAKIYGEENSTISQIEIEVPVPAAETLERMFNWSEREILDAQESSLKATIKLSGIDKQLITHDENETRGLIDCIRRNLLNYRKASVRAKYPGAKVQDYNFFDEYFYYPVDIPMYKMRMGEKYYYTAGELVEIYHDKLYNAYLENKELLQIISNR